MFIPVGTLKEECLYLCVVCCSGGCLGIACQYVNHYWLCTLLLQHCIDSQAGQALQYHISKIHYFEPAGSIYGTGTISGSLSRYLLCFSAVRYL